MKTVYTLGILCSLMLIGCGTKLPQTAQCTQQYQQCKRDCINNCPNCVKKMLYATGKRYQRYLHEEKIQGKMPARELNSYRDPLQCTKVTCNCEADHQICMQASTGIIRKGLKAMPLCG